MNEIRMKILFVIKGPGSLGFMNYPLQSVFSFGFSLRALLMRGKRGRRYFSVG